MWTLRSQLLSGLIPPHRLLSSVTATTPITITTTPAGELDPVEAKLVAEAVAASAASATDPFGKDPARHPSFIVRSAKPYNGEPPATLLTDSYITPTDLLFVRNHLPVPDIQEKDYSLQILRPDGSTAAVFTLEQLRAFPQTSVVSALTCAGNRRGDMNAAKAVRGLAWGVGAMGNTEWRGPRLRDVLLAAGVKEEEVGKTIQHLHFEGLDSDPVAGTVYAASIPADTGMDARGDCLLALEMNGAPLTRDHGFPVRVVVPGVTGARQVKWLGRIVLSQEESSSLWQQKDYKAFPPTMDWDTVDFNAMPPIQEMPVTSAICEPAEGAAVALSELPDVAAGGAAAAAGPVQKELTVKGYAYSGGGRAITRVDVSADGGKTWHVADLQDEQEDGTPSRSRHWGWTLWRADVPLALPATAAGAGAGAELELVCRAMDNSCNTQPESAASIWNYRGLVNNSYHRVKVRLQ